MPLEARLISALLAPLFTDPTPDPETNLFSIVDVTLFLFTKITRPAPAPDDGAGLKKAVRLPTECIVLVGITILYVYTIPSSQDLSKFLQKKICFQTYIHHYLPFLYNF